VWVLAGKPAYGRMRAVVATRAAAVARPLGRFRGPRELATWCRRRRMSVCVRLGCASDESVCASRVLIRDTLHKANEGRGARKVVAAEARLWPGGVSNALMLGIRCRRRVDGGGKDESVDGRLVCEPGGRRS
jgi:hypothetical protein